jgi:hypothetical protein
VPGLLAIRRIVAALESDRIVAEKRALLDQIILDCAGVSAETLIPHAEVVPGETLNVRQIVNVASGVPVLRLGLVAPSGRRMAKQPTALVQNRPDTVRASLVLPISMPLTQPYWLRRESTPGMFRVDDPSLIGLSENPPAYKVAAILRIGGEDFIVGGEPVAPVEDSLRGESTRRMAVIPPVSVGFATDVVVFQPGATKPVSVDVIANRATSRATVSLAAPRGWSVVPASRSVSLARAGDRAVYEFTVTAPRTSSATNIEARIGIAGKTWITSRDAVDYAHIPYQILQPGARFKAVAAGIATRGHRIAYIPGAGDDIPAALEQLGYSVARLPASLVTADTLRNFDAAVIGVRASNVGPEIGAVMPALTAFAEAGGVVIEQYNQSSGLRNTVLGPYPFTIANERVTNENAEVMLLAPDHPALNTPNKITARDFEGWVQERGIYFANQWDSRYTPILSMSDANEAPLKGSLLVANVGKGYFVYTGLAFFRQLPAGVPGAYRLFANLVSLGKR